jgi:hypothetical protein
MRHFYIVELGVVWIIISFFIPTALSVLLATEAVVGEMDEGR